MKEGQDPSPSIPSVQESDTSALAPINTTTWPITNSTPNISAHGSHGSLSQFSYHGLDLSLSWFTATYRSSSKGSEGSIFLSDGAGFDYSLDCGYYYNTQSFLLLMFTVVMLKNITVIRMRLDCFLYHVDVLAKRLLKTNNF